MHILSRLYTNNKEKIHLCVIIAISILLLEFFFRIVPGNEIQLLEYRFHDSLFRLRFTLFGTRNVSPYIISLAIKDSDISDSLPPDYNIKLCTQLLERLSPMGIRGIFLDILFTGKPENKQKRDLIQATKNAENVYYPVIPVDRNYSGNENEYNGKNLFYSYPVMKQDALPETKELLFPFHGLPDAARGLGHIRHIPDSDGITRKLPLLYKYCGKYIPALSFRMVCDYLSIREKNIKIIAGKHILLKDARYPSGLMKDIMIPIDDMGRMTINFTGPDTGRFLNYSLSYIYSEERGRLKQYMENTLLFVFDNTLASKDYAPGVFNKFYPLIHLHMEAVNMILKNDFLYNYSYIEIWLIKVIFYGILLLLACSQNGISYWISVIMLFFCFLLCNTLLFLFASRLPDIILPSSTLILSACLLGMYKTIETIKKEAREREREQHRLFQANKLIVLGTMSSSIAHEIANPNNAIMLESDFLSDNVFTILQGVDSMGRESSSISTFTHPVLEQEYLQSIKNIKICSLKIETIIKSLKNFYRETHPEKRECVDIHTIISASISLMAHTIRKYAILHFDPQQKDNVQVWGHSQQLEQVMINILSNSCNALFDKYQEEKKGNIFISTRNSPVEKKVIIRVEDHGAGMDNDTLKAAAEPYFTKRPDKGGTGLGLYIVKTIVDRHEGNLEIYSKQGEGTTVIVSFPCYTYGAEQ